MAKIAKISNAPTPIAGTQRRGGMSADAHMTDRNAAGDVRERGQQIVGIPASGYVEATIPHEIDVPPAGTR